MIVWYLARGAGLAALVLLSVSTALGTLTSRRIAAPNRVVLQYAHRTVATLGLGALAVHLGAILADSYAHVGWLGALVPLRSAYRPQWVALGTLAAYLFVGAALAGVLRGRLATSARSARNWRVLHGVAYAGWLAAILHGLTAGSDTGVGWVRAVYVCCAAGVVAAVAVRVSLRPVQVPLAAAR